MQESGKGNDAARRIGSRVRLRRSSLNVLWLDIGTVWEAKFFGMVNRTLFG
ncbi:MAG: hypothetical protein NT074_08710 [Methanomicrobiales archaeon]|nr:hypothetical protein [Methanomicrobiales archaeon]